MAEGKGFEPPKGISSFNDLANRRLQPLGHPSAKGQSLKWARGPTAYAPSSYSQLEILSNKDAVKITAFFVIMLCASQSAI